MTPSSQGSDPCPGSNRRHVTHVLPLEGAKWGEGLSVPGAAESFTVGLKLVDPWYFATMQIPVESGRGIEDRDRAGSPPVVVINQELARKLASQSGMRNPVGRIVRIAVPEYGSIPEPPVSLQIVGVIRSEHTNELQEPQRWISSLSGVGNFQPAIWGLLHRR
jgi:hypothetical protein